MNSPWTIKPHLASHTYWLRKEAFLLAEDTYSDWVLFAVEEGSFHFQIGEHSGTACAGDLVFCPPGAVFCRKVLSPVSFHFFTVRWVSSDPGETEAAVHTGQVPAGLVTVRDQARLASDFAYMKQIKADAARHERLDHLLADLWHIWCREWEQKQADALGRTADTLMVETAERLQACIAEPLSLKTVARELGLTPVQLTRRFHAAHGVTPLGYVTSLRLHKAQKLLLETDMTLEQIAQCCGYENGFYLSRLFSRKMRLSPSEYRRRHRL
ncbi:helix-turn-helix domain-containing protein [Paenibacillus hamazuiensis]|uniref:helix-turn-helix domain-containing protein n=1 Tax=Paenibacillus hamazuiensis TaxID=2936508 RepID=UPI00200EE644|nr:AraC family transcriptional regulator [Paenibacillus hamazuiensis]